MSFTREQLKKNYSRLPKEIKVVLDSEENTDKIYDLGSKHDLHIDKIGLLHQEINLVMLGVVKPQEFIPNLREKLKVSDEEARKIALEVNEQIFNPIRESLKQVHAMGEMAEREAGEAKVGPSDGAPKEPTNDNNKEVEAKPVSSNQMETRPNNFDDRLGRYLSSNQDKATSPAPRSYSHDPYHEGIE